MHWPDFFRGIFYSLLPQAYWGKWRPSSTVDFARSAIVSGLLESISLLYLLIVGYVHFLFVRVHQMQSAANSNEGTQLYLPAMLTVEYALHPFNLIGIFLAGEGAARAWSAFFVEEIVPSFPIKLANWLQRRMQTRRQRALQGPPIPDVTERLFGDEAELHIASQSPKEGWRVSTAVAVHEDFYEVVRVEFCAGPRPNLYILRKFPAGKVMRGIYRYEPPSDLPQK